MTTVTLGILCRVLFASCVVLPRLGVSFLRLVGMRSRSTDVTGLRFDTQKLSSVNCVLGDSNV